MAVMFGGYGNDPGSNWQGLSQGPAQNYGASNLANALANTAPQTKLQKLNTRLRDAEKEVAELKRVIAFLEKPSSEGDLPALIDKYL